MFVPQSKFCIISIANTVYLPTPLKRSKVAAVSGHSHWVLSVAWSPDGTKLASGSRDQTVRIWEAATGKQLSQLKGHSEDNPECLCEHPSEENYYEYTANPECPERVEWVDV